MGVKSCANCKYSEEMWGGLVCMGQKGMPQTTEFNVCKDWKNSATTKADRLRSMTDDELAKALTEISDRCPDGFNCDEVIFTDCCDCWLSWLQSNTDDN